MAQVALTALTAAAGLAADRAAQTVSDVVHVAAATICAFTIPPTSAGRVAKRGGFVMVHPRNDALTDTVTGCNALQVVDVDQMRRLAEAETLAGGLLRAGYLPRKATFDALHLAVAAVGRADYLVTWNMRDLAGAVVRRRLEQALRSAGHYPPTVCTPEELLPPLDDAGASDD